MSKVLKSRRTIILVCVAISVVLLASFYMLRAQYYVDHFLPNTHIESINVSDKNLDEAAALVEDGVDSKTIILTERGEDDITITAEEINLTADIATIPDILSNQNIYLWPIDLLQMTNHKIPLTTDEELFNIVLDNLSCLDEEERELSKNPSFELVDGVLLGVSEIYGNLVDRDILAQKIIDTFSLSNTNIVLDELYIQPKYTERSQEFVKALNEANDIIQKSISFNIYDIENKLTLTPEDLSSFIMFDDEMNVIANEESVRQWLREIGAEYDTVGVPKKFTTVYGKETDFPTGSYGWLTDEAAMLPVVCDAVISGENSISIDFIYKQKGAASPDEGEWGTKYIDVDISQQKVRLIDNNQIVNEFVCVTGTNNGKRNTDLGEWKVEEKLKDFMMVGADYRVPAKYFVHFGRGEGLHNSSRSSWSPTTWLYNGSHGCVNMKLADSKAVYDFSEVGMPVLVHM